jgi:hypothetical protein
MRQLESVTEVKQYVQACNVAGCGNVQLYISTFEESKKLEAQFIAINKEIELYDSALVTPKKINDLYTQIGTIVHSSTTVVSPEKINDLNSNVYSNMLPLAAGFNVEEVYDLEFKHPYDTLSVEEKLVLSQGMVHSSVIMSEAVMSNCSVGKCNPPRVSEKVFGNSNIVEDSSLLKSVECNATVGNSDVDGKVKRSSTLKKRISKKRGAVCLSKSIDERKRMI